MILAILGIVLCVGGVIGAWAVNDPATQAATGALSTIEQYSALGGQTVELVGGNVSDIKGAVDEANQALANVTAADRAQFIESVKARLDETIAPKLTRAADAAQAIGQTAVSINTTLESVNRIPGVNVPIFTDELQTVGARLQAVSAGVEQLRATLSETTFDATRLRSATGEVVTQLSAVESALNTAQARLSGLSEAAATTAARVPGWIDSISLIATLLCILFGAGQVFLFKAGLDWFKRT